MVDNFNFTPGTGGTGAAKNVGGVLYPQVIATELDGTDTGLSAKIGSTTETAPATDTASSGLNGRLQRVAQRFTSLIALLPAALTVSGNFKVAIVESTVSQAITVADGANVTIGAKADAANTATDITAISAMSVWKQISKSVQAIATSVAGTLAVSAASLPLPTGAATAAKQAALGTAGTPSADVITVQGATSMTAVKVDGSAVTQPISIAAPVSTNATLQTGSNIVGKVGIDQTTPGTTNGVSAVAATAGGATPYKLNSAATTNATSLKASAGQLYMVAASNNGAGAAYLKFYNKASAPTVGTDTPILVFEIPVNATAANGAGTNIPVPDCGLAFNTGIAFAITGGIADSDTTAVTLNQVVVNLAYK